MSLNYEVMARTLYGEAAIKHKNQSEADERAELAGIAWTSVTRAKMAQSWFDRHGATHILYGNGEVWSALLARRQYSTWDGGPYTRQIGQIETENMRLKGGEVVVAWARCQEVAKGVLEGRIPDPTGGATHYHAAGIELPPWAKVYKFLCRLGDHLFYLSTDPV